MRRARPNGGFVEVGIERHFFRVKSGLMEAAEGEEPKPFYFWVCNGCNWESGTEFETPRACKDDLAFHVERHAEEHAEAFEKWISGQY